MDASHLHFIAGRICDWLAFKQQTTLKHSQALDCVAALPGLRNWPEVLAFPKRVAAAIDFDRDVCERLADRINTKTEGKVTSSDLMFLLMETWHPTHPELWPDGPQNGLYLTTSKEAVEAAIARFEAAYSNTIMYAEDPGFHADGVVALGENGIFSAGMQRVPSGTLFVLGPLVLTEENWGQCRERMAAAVGLPGRVVILIDTPQPEHMFEDVMLLLQEEVELFRFEEALARLRGVVKKDGTLADTSPLGLGRRIPQAVAVTPSRALPQALAEVLQSGIARRKYGFVIAGSFEEKPQRAALLEATLPYTDYAGPAARILSDDRIGYDGDPPLSACFAGLPVFPSVESAYRSGYRRMVVERPYLAEESLLRYANSVCFHLTGLGWQASEVLLRVLDHAMRDAPEVAAKTIAALAIANIDGKKGSFSLFDALPAPESPRENADFEELIDFVETHRALRWQDQLANLLAAGQVTLAEAKNHLRGADLNRFKSSHPDQ